MYGNINWQVQEIYQKSGIKQIGQSKHKAKEEVRRELASQNIPATWHAIGKQLGIFSYSTADAYRDVWRQIGKFAKNEFKVRDMEKLTGEHIQSFLEKKISDNVSYGTFSQYASACEKLETALNGYSRNFEKGNVYNFHESIKSTRTDANEMLVRFSGSRAYINPKAIIENIRTEKYQTVARMQFESGARVRECNHIYERHLCGIVKDPITGDDKGRLFIENGKGGISGYKYVSVQTYQDLKQMIGEDNNSQFKFCENNYRVRLKEAAQTSRQRYNGTHGLRWNFARLRFQEVQRKGGRLMNRLFSR